MYLELNRHIEVMHRTEQSKIFTEDSRLIHGLLGIVTEYFELVKLRRLSYNTGKMDKVNLIEELGDLVWYLCLCVDELNYSVNEHGFDMLATRIEKMSEVGICNKSLDEILDDFWVHTLDSISDAVKAKLFYNRCFKVDMVLDALATILMGLFIIAEMYDIPLTVICTINNAKLRKRYPEKFTTYCANTRDIDAERKTLEQIE